MAVSRHSFVREISGVGKSYRGENTPGYFEARIVRFIDETLFRGYNCEFEVRAAILAPVFRQRNLGSEQIISRWKYTWIFRRETSRVYVHMGTLQLFAGGDDENDVRGESCGRANRLGVQRERRVTRLSDGLRSCQILHLIVQRSAGLAERGSRANTRNLDYRSRGSRLSLSLTLSISLSLFIYSPCWGY